MTIKVLNEESRALNVVNDATRTVSLPRHMMKMANINLNDKEARVAICDVDGGRGILVRSMKKK